MGNIAKKLLQLYESEQIFEDDEEIEETPKTDVTTDVKKEELTNTYKPIIIRGSYFEDEVNTSTTNTTNTTDSIDEIDFETDDYFTQIKDNPPKDEGNLGVFLYQSILSIIIAIIYTLMATFITPVSQNILSTVQQVSRDDFTFNDILYQSLGNFFIYINEQKPLELNTQIINGIIKDIDETYIIEYDIVENDMQVNEEITQDVMDNTQIIEDIEVDEKDVIDEVDEIDEVDGIDGIDEVDGIEEVVDFEEIEVEAMASVNLQEIPANVTLMPVIFAGDITFPINDYYYVSSDYGFRVNPITKENEFHTAYDLACNKGVDILSVLDGVVITSRVGNDLGNYITIDHGNGLTSLYAHCDELFVAVGDVVKQGDIIATVGSTGTSTGNHLHFAMKIDGVYIDPSYIFTTELTKTEIEDN